ncbi:MULTISPECIES: hypothetical protein [Streptomyces]|uniref:Uncharacterized protein n=1 Tax=Streptomyces galilaeus TaxID=33899 RepID=A0ABW9IXQ8_STRGJ
MPEPPDQTRGSSRLPGTSWFAALTSLIESGEELTDYTLGQALETQGLSGIPAALYTLPLRRPAGSPRKRQLVREAPPIRGFASGFPCRATQDSANPRAFTGWEWKDEDEYAHVRRLGIVSDSEHQAVDDARAQVLAMLADRAGVFAHVERWAAWVWEPAWPTPRLPRPTVAAKRVAPAGG